MSNNMEVLKYIGMGVILLLDVVIIICVLLQTAKSFGLSGLVSGVTETFFGKNKGMDKDAKIARILKISAIVFLVLSVALTVLVNRT